MGERRLRAVRSLGHGKIRAIIVEADDTQMVEQALVENLLRADLNEIEVAEGLLRLQSQYAYTLTRLAERLGKSRPAVSNTLRLLELPAGVQELIRKGRLSAGHGRAVLAFPQQDRQAAALRAVEQQLSVRELEKLASSQAAGTKRSRRKDSKVQGPSSVRSLRQAEEQLIAHLGTKVSISETGGQGSISISYHGAEDLQRVLDLLLRGSSPF
jgi:ParB family chromosome partitioning protein